jgi:hypothetical protein
MEALSEQFNPVKTDRDFLTRVRLSPFCFSVQGWNPHKSSHFKWIMLTFMGERQVRVALAAPAHFAGAKSR